MKRCALVLMMALTACGGGSKAPEIYALQPPAAPLTQCGARASITIGEPVARPGLDSARIVVTDKPNHQTFYQAVRWSGPVPAMLQHYFAERFEQSGMFRNVTTDMSAVQQPWQLEVQLREFSVNQAAGVVQVRYTANLIPSDARQPERVLRLRADEPIAPQSIEGIITAFNRAMDRTSETMLRTWQPLLGCR